MVVFAKGTTVKGTYLGSSCGDVCYMHFKTSKGDKHFYGYIEDYKNVKKGHSYLVTYEKMSPMVAEVGKINVQGIVKIKPAGKSAAKRKKRKGSAAKRPSWCPNARTYVEKHICRNPKMYELEAALLESLRHAKKGKSKSAQKAITRSQRSWIKERERACKRQGDGCIIRYFENRIAFLQGKGGTSHASAKQSSGKGGKDLKNMTYIVNREAVRLRNGKYKRGYDTVDFIKVLAKGDLNGDGKRDYVVLLVTGGGGSGIFDEMAVVLQTKNGLRALPAISLGDRVQLRSTKIKNRQIVVDVTEHGPNDPACCPSKKARHYYKISGNRVVKLR
jgi:uncharacterized protein YecT (DUF1311 family)